MGIAPVISVSGNEESRNASSNHNKKKQEIYTGKNCQINDQPANIFEQHSDCLPDVFGGLTISLTRHMCLFTQLNEICIQCIWIRSNITLPCNFSNDGRTHINSWK